MNERREEKTSHQFCLPIVSIIVYPAVYGRRETEILQLHRHLFTTRFLDVYDSTRDEAEGLACCTKMSYSLWRNVGTGVHGVLYYLLLLV